MRSLWSRRAVLSALAATTAVKAAEDTPATVPGEFRRFRDPATEFELLRLTDPAKASAFLPPPPLRSIARNRLLYCSDRGGSMQAWRMDLRTGESRCLTRAEDLHPLTLGLTADDKGIVYFDGGELIVNAGKPKIICAVEPGWKFADAFTLSDDGTTAAWAEERTGRYRVRIANIPRGNPATLFEADEPVQYVRLRPKRPGVLYNHQGVLTLAEPSGRNSHRLPVASGTVGFALWSADGKSFSYLLTPKERSLVQLREHFPETGEDKLIGPTTQFISYARNSDSTMFAGVSGSKAAPYLLLFARSARRELTIAEHKASSAERVAVAFAPNSQKLYFCTDREGRPAVYVIGLERFVEQTEDEDAGRDGGESRGKGSRSRTGRSPREPEP